MKYKLNKNITINAPLASVRALVEDFSQWSSWSPWTVLEPGCRVDVSGLPNAVGHSMRWEGDVIGAGKNTMRAADPLQLRYDLEILKPWKSKADVRFEFEDLGEQTRVTWTMDSSMPFFMFFMIKTVKNMVGMDYERGLIMLKAIAETGQLNCQTTDAGVVDHAGFSYVGIKRSVAIADMPETIAQDFQKLVDDIVVTAGKGAEHWVCIYPKFDMRKMRATYIAAVSDEDLASVNLGADYIKGQIKAAKAYEIKHDGPYDFIGNAWAMGMMTIQAKKHKAKDYPFEQYWNSPLEEAPENLRTSVYFPLKK